MSTIKVAKTVSIFAEKNDEVDSTAGTIEGVSKNQSESQREKQLEESKDDIRESKAQKRETAAKNKNKSIETSTTIEEETATMIKTESVETTNLFTDYTKRPRFVIYPSSHWSAADIPLKIEVEVTKSPDLKVNWYHDDKLVVPGGWYHFYCILKNSWAYNYICVYFFSEHKHKSQTLDCSKRVLHETTGNGRFHHRNLKFFQMTIITIINNNIKNIPYIVK